MKKMLLKLTVPAALVTLAVLISFGCSNPAGGGDDEDTTTRYTVTFDTHGGPEVSSVTADAGTAVSKPVDPIWSGYTFLGWFPDAGGGTLYDWPYTVTGDVTMHARWDSGSPTQYTVTFDSEGMTVGSASAYDGTTINKPADPVRSDYAFNGWYSAGTGGTLYAWPYTVTGSVTMYAQWRANTDSPPERYTITFESHGGLAVQPVTADTGTQVSEPAAPYRNGYTFDGWFDAASSGTLHTWAYTLTENVTMHAQWTPVDYPITYHLNDGTNGANPATYTIESTAITLVPATRDGYGFGGWYSDAGFTPPVVTGISTGSTGDITLYAKWTLDSYTITYNLGGGTNAGTNPASYTITSGAITLAPATRNGYTFGGWYNDAEFTLPAVTEIPASSTGDKTFYAKWILDSYAITYTLDGGINAGSNPANYTIESGAITLAAPTRSGFNFAGWYNNAGFTPPVVTGIPAGSTGDKTFYAKWTLDSYTITYNLGGGTNAGSNPASYNIASGVITLAPATRDGFNFEGWYNDAVFTLPAVTEIPASSTGDKTFYAKWTVTVSFEANGGTPAPGNKTVTEGGKVTEPATMTKAGLTFGGWYKEVGLATPWNFVTDTVTKNTTLYAKWTANVTFDANDGTPAPENQTVTEGGKAAEPPPPTKTNLAFDGWYKEAGLTTPWNFTTDPVTANTTLYAKWTANVTFNATGGTSVQPQTVTEGGKAAEPPPPTKTNLAFGGWYKEPALTNQWNFDTNVTANTTLYARWTADVTFNATGGTSVQPQTVTEGDKATAPTAPTKTGFSFSGWYKEAGLANLWDFAADTVAVNTTLYARWLPEVSVNVSVWVNEDGEILMSNADKTISRSASGYAVSFTATVTSEYSGVQWYLNGVPIPGGRGTAQSVTIKAADYYNGSYYLGVTVTKDSVPYSTNIHFTVVN